MRVTGLGTGLDMDKLVKETMQPYRIKIQQQQQQKEIAEIKQQLYRDVIKESRELYNKYFDVSKTDSLLLSKNWSSVKFQTSNENVLTVAGGSDVKSGNYTVTGNTATAAKAIVTEGLDSGNSLVINGKEFTLQGDTAKARAENLNKELKAAGMNVSVRYSDFAGTEAGNQSGFIFESTVLGKDSTFTIGGTSSLVGTIVDGIDATAATVTGFSVSDFKYDANNTITLTVDGKPISIEISGASIKKDGADEIDNEKLKTVLNEKLKAYKLAAEVSENGDITFSSKVLGSKVENSNMKINGSVGVFTKGTDATYTTNTLDKSTIDGKTISINGMAFKVDFSEAAKNGISEQEYIDNLLVQQNVNMKAKIEGSNIVFTSNIAGSKGKADIGILDTSTGITMQTQGTNGEIIIKDDKGGTYTYTGTSNTVILDGMTFKFTGEIPTEGISVNGKSDVTKIKDKLVDFINDYNKLIEKLNTLTTEKRNKNYMPLTDEQKKELSESEIKLWNEKVRKGQLYKDSDISRIANSMKSSMRGLVNGVNGSMEKFGIKPVSDYQGTKNGTFSIDELKLTEALENRTEDVMKFFTSTPTEVEGLSEQEKYNSTGVAERLKSIFFNETVTTNSALIKKAGIEGSASISNNELTKSIEKYDRKMVDMEKDFSRREQQLYSKWATIESMMNKLNSQQSYLISQLGM
ncbi:flagellar cap protein FliD [Clostridium sulfidigenes]|uniref:Flagellar hook-associated protein 2 n=1 Tax=Clostridium sulfidigenes TaxID=318464 RepID=A0A084JIL6_9CLOT|nr:flagellar filament capping protein FliD [Clostridium sulfidigenes]KEZ88800.1 flagellar cap protein FliD [Clostridium sulfidigenes]